jgi:hypothetical protein
VCRANYIWGNHQAATTAQFFTTPTGRLMSNNDTVEFGVCGIRQVNWERLGTSPVQEEAIGESFDPALRPPDLFSRFQDGPLKPSAPVEFEIAGRRKCALLIGENYDVILEYNEQVTDFFAIPSFGAMPLVTIDTRIAP